LFFDPLDFRLGGYSYKFFLFIFPPLLTAEECEDYVSERQVQRLALITLSLSLSLHSLSLVLPPSSFSSPVKERHRGTNSRDGEVKQFGDRK